VLNCKESDHESISTRYRWYQRYWRKNKSQIRKPIVSQCRYHIDKKKKSFLFDMASSCKGIDHESISIRYRRYQLYRHKKKSQMGKPIVTRYRYYINTKIIPTYHEKQLEANRSWIDINTISSISTKSTQKEITKEKTDNVSTSMRYRHKQEVILI
jgi:hypothetical protein